jgi:hypothetical protein
MTPFSFRAVYFPLLSAAGISVILGRGGVTLRILTEPAVAVVSVTDSDGKKTKEGKAPLETSVNFHSHAKYVISAAPIGDAARDFRTTTRDLTQAQYASLAAAGGRPTLTIELDKKEIKQVK